MDTGVNRPENILVQVTTIKLSKDNYIKWYAAIKVGIASHDRIFYINRKVKQDEKDTNWNT